MMSVVVLLVVLVSPGFHVDQAAIEAAEFIADATQDVGTIAEERHQEGFGEAQEGIGPGHPGSPGQERRAHQAGHLTGSVP